MDKTHAQAKDHTSRGPELVSEPVVCKRKCLTNSRYKDYDVTWLYGPLQTNDGITSGSKTISSSSNKKPILKKRSTLDTISQGSFFSTSVDQLNKDNGIIRVTSIQLHLLPSSILRLLFSTGERKHVRFCQEITVYSY